MVNTKSASMRIAALLLAVLTMSLFLGDLDLSANAESSPGFYVSGTNIMDANGNAFVMRGVNIAHAWYSSYTEDSIRAAAQNGANTVRVVVADGSRWSKTSKSDLSSIISMCRENKVVCILEVHDATGSDNIYDLDAAVNYWIENKSVLQGNEKYVIVNIANEWYGSWNGSSWAEGYKTAIKALRNAGISNMLMVDCAGWGQYPDSIKYYGREVFNADSQANTVFSIHMYEYAGGNANTVRTNIDNALGIGVPVVIGEFGGQHTNGDVDEATIMSYCTQKGVGYLGWSWKGNSSDLAYLDIANDWSGSSLTSWGNTLINGSSGIKATSKTCTIFTGETPADSSSEDSSEVNDSSSETASDTSSETDNSSEYVSLFWGEGSAGAWGQAVSVMTSKNGGSFDASNIKPGGHFYVEYTSSDKEQIELILQSWSGGEGWAKVWASEYGSANGHHFAKFSYDDCVSAFRSSNFPGLLDKLYVGCKTVGATVYSVCYDYGTGSTDTDSSSEVIPDSSSAAESTAESAADSTLETENEGDPYVSLFWGESSAGAWGQPVSVMTSKNGGPFDAANITRGGYFYVEYSNSDQKQIELILQSWSGAEGWAKVQASEYGSANGHHFAKFSYDDCVSTFGSSYFSGYLDQIHVGCKKDTTTVYSVCYCYP